MKKSSHKTLFAEFFHHIYIKLIALRLFVWNFNALKLFVSNYWIFFSCTRGAIVDFYIIYFSREKNSISIMIFGINMETSFKLILMLFGLSWRFSQNLSFYQHSMWWLNDRSLMDRTYVLTKQRDANFGSIA